MGPNDDQWTDCLCLALDTGGFGGIETHVAILAEALRAAGKAVVVLSVQRLQPSHPLRRRLREAGIPLREADGSWDFIRRLRALRPAVVHSHGYKANLLSRFTALTAPFRHVSSFHAGDPGVGRVRLYTAVDELTAILSKRVAVSRPIAQRIPWPTPVIENFVPFPDDLPMNAADGGIGFVGRLSPEKGADLFCTMAQRLFERGIAGPYHVFGDGPLRSTLEATASAIRFHGAVGDLQEQLSTLRCIVMPSRAEGLPMAALEAMARGVPVVATAVGDLPRLIEHGVNGWLVPPGDPNALERTVEEVTLLPVDAYRTVTAAAQRTIRQRYAAPVQLPRFLSLYGAVHGQDMIDGVRSHHV